MRKMTESGEILTERLLLRKFRDEDLERFADMMADDQVGKQLPRGEGYSFAEVSQWLQGIKKGWEHSDYGIWAVEEQISGEFIGYAGLNRIEQLNEIEVLYAYAREYWNQGYATEAAAAVLEYAFRQLGLKKVVGLARPDNTGSCRVLEKIGLEYRKTIEILGMTCRYYEIEGGYFLERG